MEKCKFCQAELEEGVTLCPACGKDNAAEETLEAALETEAAPAEEIPEENAAEELPEAENPEVLPSEAAPAPKTRKNSPVLIAALVVAIVALVAMMAALVVTGMKGFDTRTPKAEPVVEGNKDPASPSCKGTYTATDKQVERKSDVVVATAGSYELTLGELQIYYWQEVTSFLNQYGYYASYYGLDVTQPLESQACGVMEGMSWQQFFLYRAINSWHSYQALAAEAEANGFQMDQETADFIATIPEQLSQQASTSGFADAQALVQFNLGAGPTVEEYVHFMEIYYHGYLYFNDFYSNATASQEEIEAMFADHEEEYAQMGLTKDTKTVNVRHILVYPEGATSETVRTEEFSEEAWAAGKATAEEILQQWLDGEKTEESFAALAEAHSQDPGSAANGGLYTDVYEGDMVTNFNDWCFDSSRQVGDYGIVETEFGYHIMFYSGETYQWSLSAEADVISEKTNQMVDAALEKYPLTVYYNKVLLSEAPAYTTSVTVQ